MVWWIGTFHPNLCQFPCLFPRKWVLQTDGRTTDNRRPRHNSSSAKAQLKSFKIKTDNNFKIKTEKRKTNKNLLIWRIRTFGVDQRFQC